MQSYTTSNYNETKSWDTLPFPQQMIVVLSPPPHPIFISIGASAVVVVIVIVVVVEVLGAGRGGRGLSSKRSEEPGTPLSDARGWRRSSFVPTDHLLECQSGTQSSILTTRALHNVACHSSLLEWWISCSLLHDFFPVEYDSLGCFKDGTPRALPELLENFRKNIDWMNMAKIVQACAEVAHARGLQTFGLQFYGECWSGVHGSSTYDTYGPSKNCWSGVGKEGSYYVYRFKV